MLRFYMSGPERVLERARRMLSFYMSEPERVLERARARSPKAMFLYERARHPVWAFKILKEQRGGVAKSPPGADGGGG